MFIQVEQIVDGPLYLTMIPENARNGYDIAKLERDVLDNDGEIPYVIKEDNSLQIRFMLRQKDERLDSNNSQDSD